jgi:integrase
LKVIRIHDYRHSHVSVLANNGINIQEIARRLGHSKVDMTWNTYSHLYPREEERAVDVLNNIA